MKFEEKLFIKRGVLFIFYSIFDFFGFVVLFIFLGCMIFRELMELFCDWDEFLFVEIER